MKMTHADSRRVLTCLILLSLSIPAHAGEPPRLRFRNPRSIFKSSLCVAALLIGDEFANPKGINHALLASATSALWVVNGIAVNRYIRKVIPFVETKLGELNEHVLKFNLKSNLPVSDLGKRLADRDPHSRVIHLIEFVRDNPKVIEQVDTGWLIDYFQLLRDLRRNLAVVTMMDSTVSELIILHNHLAYRLGWSDIFRINVPENLKNMMVGRVVYMLGSPILPFIAADRNN